MRIEQLKSFICVYETGSFTAAAQKLYTEQPVITKHIAQLERELACPLFTRTTRKVIPTREGDAFYPKAREAVLLIDEGVAEIRMLSAKTSANLNVGYTYYYMDVTSTKWLSEFEGSMTEGASVAIHELTRPRILEGIINGDIDCAFLSATSENPFPSYLEKILIMTMGEIVIVGQTHRLADRDSLAVDDLLYEDFAYSDRPPTDEDSIVVKDFECLGKTMHVRNTTFEASAIRLVESGEAVLDLPERCRVDSTDVVVIPYTSNRCIQYYLVWNPGNKNELLHDFITYVKEKIGAA
jgi:DNA-binding transcriptional LysR family regulator